MMSRLRVYVENAVPLFVFVGLLVSFLLYFSGFHDSSRYVRVVVLILGSFPFVRDMVVSILHRNFGIDLIAAVGIISSLFIGEYTAGCVILLMLSGGKALEQYALGRARKELTALLSRAPTHAHRKKGKLIEDVVVGAVVKDEALIVKQGEVIPVDGIIVTGSCLIDESSLTGESIPVEKKEHAHVMSGSICVDGILEIKALRPSSESKYEQIVRLVRQAEKNKAPFVRLADRYSVGFTVVTFTIAILAWFFSHDPVRALSVLVVATPCPLILAAPIAFVSGMSKAAKRGIIIKSGKSLELLSQAKSILFDKTGTLTLGIPRVLRVKPQGKHTADTIVQIAAGLDQLSTHILAHSLILYAKEKDVLLEIPTDFNEQVGRGVRGVIKGKKYFLGKIAFLQDHHIHIPNEFTIEQDQIRNEGVIAVYLATVDEFMGVIYFADTIRENVQDQFKKLGSFIHEIVMVTGDKLGVANSIAKTVGISHVLAECLPEDKLKEVQRLKNSYGPVVMVGDGINDAPALAAADVGIALGSQSSTAAHEAGDVIIAVDSFDRVVEVFAISKRVLFIAKQCIFVGIGLSIGLMVLAAFGFVTPVVGALLQEVIDVVVILNALRVHTGPTKTFLPNYANR